MGHGSHPGLGAAARALAEPSSSSEAQVRAWTQTLGNRATNNSRRRRETLREFRSTLARATPARRPPTHSLGPQYTRSTSRGAVLCLVVNPHLQ